MGGITVVGIGIGGAEYLLPLAMKKITRAEVIAGSPDSISRFAAPRQARFEIEQGWLAAAPKLCTLAAKKKVALLVSGSPNLYSFAGTLKRKYPELSIEVVPGISSYQYLAAKTGVALNNAAFVSLHGKTGEAADAEYSRLKKLSGLVPVLIVFTDREHNPGTICRHLLDGEHEKWTAHIGCSLGSKDEWITQIPLAECGESWEDARQLCVMILEKQ